METANKAVSLGAIGTITITSGIEDIFNPNLSTFRITRIEPQGNNLVITTYNRKNLEIQVSQISGLNIAFRYTNLQ